MTNNDKIPDQNQDKLTEKTKYNESKSKYSFRKVPFYARYIAKFRDFKENTAETKDNIKYKIPKTLRYLKFSPQTLFLGSFILGGVFIQYSINYLL